MKGGFLNKIKSVDLSSIDTFLKKIWDRIVYFIRGFSIIFFVLLIILLIICIFLIWEVGSSIHKFLRNKWECLKKTCIGKFCQKHGETILFFAFLGLGIGWLGVVSIPDVHIYQKNLSILASGLFIFLICYRQKKLKDLPKLKDDRNAEINMNDRYTEKKTFFDYFSYRSYISRHRLKVDEKYFALWKTHYPYNQYKSQEKFANAQEVKRNNTAENNYQKKLKEKVENKILKSSKSFISICMWFAFIYAIYCFYGIYCKKAEDNKKAEIHKNNIIGTTQDVIFTYQSSLLEEGQKMEIKVSATMLKYNYKGKHFHANNLQAVYNKGGIDTFSYSIIELRDLQFYIDEDTLKHLNKTNEYPELNDLKNMLKYKNDSISKNIKVIAKKDTVIPFKKDSIFLSFLSKYTTQIDTSEYRISSFKFLKKDTAKLEKIIANLVKCIVNKDTISADGFTLSYGNNYFFYIDTNFPDAKKIAEQLGREKIREGDSLILSKITKMPFTDNQKFINSKEKYYSQKRVTIFTKTWQNTIDLLLDLLTTILLLFSYNSLSNTTTQEHKQHKNWNIIVLLTFCAILVLMDIYVAKMLVEDKYIFAHWIIDSIASLFAAMTIASFASRMYPQYRKNNLTKGSIFDVFGFFMIYIYACVNILDPFVKEEIINVDLELISRIMAIVRFAGVSSLYFVMFSFSEKRNMNMFFIHEINNLRTMEKENIGFKELHLLMHNKDREEELLDKDKAGEKDELDLLVEMKKREKKLSKLQK